MITPANKARIKPGTVAIAKILPKANSEFVSSKTNQLMEIILNPNPIREIILPMKNKRKVGLFKILIIEKISKSKKLKILKELSKVIRLLWQKTI
jgi:hypothetical protein